MLEPEYRIKQTNSYRNGIMGDPQTLAGEELFDHHV